MNFSFIHSFNNFIRWWGVGVGGGGLNYLRAHIHLRFRHAHHETKDWLPRGRKGAIEILKQLGSMSEGLKKPQKQTYTPPPSPQQFKRFRKC